ncbi:MAG: hypothetical protein NC319_04165 [Butyricicoccus sp.]|nr:hypothetical protein [Butyricicoccus sp.]
MSQTGAESLPPPKKSGSPWASSAQGPGCESKIFCVRGKDIIMFCGNGNGNCCLWIIIILIILFACGGNGCGNNNCCCNDNCNNNCCC